MVIKTINGKKLDIKPNEIRYRLISPKKVDVVGRRKMTDGVSIVVGCPKGKSKVIKVSKVSKRTERCTVGTEAQSLRFDRQKFTPGEAANWIKKHWSGR